MESCGEKDLYYDHVIFIIYNVTTKIFFYVLYIKQYIIFGIKNLCNGLILRPKITKGTLQLYFDLVNQFLDTNSEKKVNYIV